MDRLEAMALFLEVVDGGSMSAAGRLHGIPLATVSRKIADLEAHLKTRLFTRSTRRLTLTDAGLLYAAACKRILEEVSDAERKAAGEYVVPKGDLVMTAPVAFGRLHVLPIVTDFLAAYPDIDVRLILADRLNHLVDEHIDLALRIGELPDSAMVAARVGIVRHVLCAAPAYLARHGTPTAPEDVANHQCIAFDSLGPARHWTFGETRSARRVAIRPRLTLDAAQAAVDAAVAGTGITRVLSYQCAAAVAAGELRLLLESFEPAPRPVHLVHTGQGILPLKVRAFMDFAAPRLRDRLAEVASVLGNGHQTG